MVESNLVRHASIKFIELITKLICRQVALMIYLFKKISYKNKE